MVGSNDNPEWHAERLPVDPEDRDRADGGVGFEIIGREDFSESTFLLEIRHPAMAKAARPGQFVIVITHEHGERIP